MKLQRDLFKLLSRLYEGGKKGVNKSELEKIFTNDALIRLKDAFSMRKSWPAYFYERGEGKEEIWIIDMNWGVAKLESLNRDRILETQTNILRRQQKFNWYIALGTMALALAATLTLYKNYLNPNKVLDKGLFGVTSIAFLIVMLILLGTIYTDIIKPMIRYFRRKKKR